MRKKLIIVSISVLLIFVAAVFIILMVNKKNTNEIDVQNTDLSKVDKSQIQDYVDRLTAQIDGLPSNVDSSMSQAIQKQLGYILREKYGSNSLKGVVRGDVLSDVNDVSNMLVDIKEKNETYLVVFGTTAVSVSVQCASQEQQINPASSKCITAPADDSYRFPNG